MQVTDRTSLTRDTTTFNSDVRIQFLNHVDQFQRLTNYHAGSFTTEVLFQRTLVDYDLPLPGLMKIELRNFCGDQCRSIDFQPLPIIQIRCRLTVSVPRGCARCQRKLSVYGTWRDQRAFLAACL